MVWNLVLGFALLVAASYVGTTLALRGFFGRRYFDPESGRFSATADERYREDAGIDDSETDDR